MYHLNVITHYPNLISMLPGFVPFSPPIWSYSQRAVLFKHFLLLYSSPFSLLEWRVPYSGEILVIFVQELAKKFQTFFIFKYVGFPNQFSL